MFSYRIVRYENNAGYGLHEVFFTDPSKPHSMTVNPIQFVVDSDEGPLGIVESLQRALADAHHLPVLNEVDIASKGSEVGDEEF